MDNNNNKWDGEDRSHRMFEPESTTWERHGQSILAALILGGIMYIAGQTINANTQIEIINVKLSVMTDQLKESSKDRYTALDAKQDFQVRDAQALRTDTTAKSLETKIDSMERRLDRVENRFEQEHSSKDKR